MMLVLRCVALVSAVVLCSASTASAESYTTTCHSMSNAPVDVTAYRYSYFYNPATMNYQMTKVLVGQGTATAQFMMVPMVGPNGQIQYMSYYMGHRGTVNSTGSASSFSGTYRNAAGVLIGVTVSGTPNP